MSNGRLHGFKRGVITYAPYASVLSFLLGLASLLRLDNIPVSVTFFALTFGLVIYRAVEKKRARKQAQNKVAVFLPRSEEAEYFWHQFHQEVDRALEKYGYETQSRFLETGKEYNAEDQLRKLKGFPWDSVAGAIICPTRDDLLEELVNLVREGRKVIVHDVSPEKLFYYFSREDVPAPYYVAIDNEAGGRIGARIMFDCLRKRGNNKAGFDILIIPGNNRQLHSNKRIFGFQNEMQKLSQNKVAWYFTDEGNWNYNCATESTESFFRENQSFLSKGRRLDGIFACNDEMAMAVEALIRHKVVCEQLDSEWLEVVLVGFDATQSIVREMKKHETGIIGTIDAKVETQAAKVVSLVKNLLDSKSCALHDEVVQPQAVTGKCGKVG